MKTKNKFHNNKISKIINVIFEIIFVCFLLFLCQNLHFNKEFIQTYCKAETPVKQQKVSKNYKRNVYEDSENCENQIVNMPKIQFEYCGKMFYPENCDNISSKQKEIIKKGFNSRVKTMNFAFANGFSKRQAVLYSFPELVLTYENINKAVTVLPQNAFLSEIKNTAKVKTNLCKNGVKLNEFAFFDMIFNKFNNFSDSYNFKIPTEKVLPEIDDNTINQINKLRGSFETDFSSSSVSRKHNIKKALSNFDGLMLNPGESFSFNNITGARTEENGYQKAKIIKNGTFVPEFGGGVCQVSTTIYNAAVLSDLEIVESHPHSLPVSYVDASFDAMVSGGSSDLVIRNNQEYPIIFAVSSQNDKCKVCVYGSVNPYKIVRKSEKINENLHFDTVYSDDYLAYGKDNSPLRGEKWLISSGKPGFTAQSKLFYYKNGVLCKTKSLRRDVYRPVKEVYLVNSEDLELYTSGKKGNI